MCILVFAKSEDEIYYQKFLTESDMNKFMEENDDLIFVGSRILN